MFVNSLCNTFNFWLGDEDDGRYLLLFKRILVLYALFVVDEPLLRLDPFATTIVTQTTITF